MLFGELIAIVFLPVPRSRASRARCSTTAATLLLALAGSFILSLTLVPVLASC
jgi:Cu/Ag efflux pump CusA